MLCWCVCELLNFLIDIVVMVLVNVLKFYKWCDVIECVSEDEVWKCVKVLFELVV